LNNLSMTKMLLIFISGGGFDTEDALEQAGEKADELVADVSLSNEIDDFSGFGDDFDISDLIQDDEAEAS